MDLQRRIAPFGQPVAARQPLGRRKPSGPLLPGLCQVKRSKACGSGLRVGVVPGDLQAPGQRQPRKCQDLGARTMQGNAVRRSGTQPCQGRRQSSRTPLGLGDGPQRRRFRAVFQIFARYGFEGLVGLGRQQSCRFDTGDDPRRSRQGPGMRPPRLDHRRSIGTRQGRRFANRAHPAGSGYRIALHRIDQPKRQRLVRGDRAA